MPLFPKQFNRFTYWTSVHHVFMLLVMVNLFFRKDNALHLIILPVDKANTDRAVFAKKK